MWVKSARSIYGLGSRLSSFLGVFWNLFGSLGFIFDALLGGLGRLLRCGPPALTEESPKTKKTKKQWFFACFWIWLTRKTKKTKVFYRFWLWRNWKTYKKLWFFCFSGQPHPKTNKKLWFFVFWSWGTLPSEREVHTSRVAQDQKKQKKHSCLCVFGSGWPEKPKKP